MNPFLGKHYPENTQQNVNSVLASIAVYIKAAQVECAKYLQLKTERFTRRRKKLLLLLFSFLFGSCSIIVMLYSFIITNSPVQTPAITFPKYAFAHTPKPKIRDSLILKNEYERINHFQHYLEHLQNDAEGKKTYDSLMQVRPFLLDSIHKLDSIFFKQ